MHCIATPLNLCLLCVNFNICFPRFGFLEKPLSQFSCTTLMHKGANNEEGEEDDDDEDPGVHVRSSKNTFNAAASAVPIQSPHGPPQRECVTEKSVSTPTHTHINRASLLCY